jgi:hypothetical protein
VAVEARVDWRVAAEGAAITLAVAVPPVWVVMALKSRDTPGQESNLWLIAPVALLAGFALGGYAMGKRVASTPLLHAAVAGGVAFAVLLVVSLARRLLSGEGISVVHVVRLLLLAQICVSAALLGGYVAVRRAGRSA